MYANVLETYGRLQWKEVRDPVPGPGDVLIKLGYASICGSDQHIYKGEFHPRTQLPLIPGHEFAGTVEEVGADVRDFEKGDRVAVDPIIWCAHCPACEIGHYPACTSLKLLGVDMDGGFGQYVTAKPHMLFRLPDNISHKHGALVEVLGIGFHAARRVGVKEKDTVVIWGTGKVGHCVLQAVKTKTREQIILVDIIQERLDRAQSIYPDVLTVNALKEDPVAAVHAHTGGRGVDIAFEVVGHDTSDAAAINPVRGCIQSIRGAGKVCVLGLGDDPAPILFKELIWKEGQIIASRVTHGEFAEVIEQMAAGNLHPEALITEVLPASAADEGFGLLESRPKDHLKILLEF